MPLSIPETRVESESMNNSIRLIVYSDYL